MKDFVYRTTVGHPDGMQFICKRLESHQYVNVETKNPAGERLTDPERTNSAIRISGNLCLSDVDLMLFELFGEAAGQYLQKHPKCSISKDQGYDALKYEVGQEYKAHVDAGPSEPRVLSGILYLNDAYEGGELFFPELDLEIKPRAGEVVLFPSNFCFVHLSKPVIKGVKHAVVTWFT